MASLYFQDFAVGTVFDLGSVTVTREAIIEFAEQFDPQPFHIDEAAAAESAFGGLIASGWHTGSMWMRLYADTVLANVVDGRGSPGVEEMRWRAPVRPGDTLTGSTTVVDVAASGSDPTRGTVFTESSMTNQHGVVVMTLAARGLFGRRPEPDAISP